METIVAPNMDVDRRGVLIGFAIKLGNGLGGIPARRNSSQSLTLLIAITRVVGTSEMVFTNSIMTIHVNRTIDQPLMSSMAIRGYRSANAMNPRGGYQEPFVITS